MRTFGTLSTRRWAAVTPSRPARRSSPLRSSRTAWPSSFGSAAPAGPPDAAAARTSFSSRSTPCAPTMSAATATRARLDPDPRRPRRAGRPLRDRDLPCAADRSFPRLDPDRAHPSGPRLPRQRRVRAARAGEDGGRRLPAAGYRTAAFVSGFPLDRRFGFDRGFDTYDDHLPRGNDRRRTPYVERSADPTTDAALRWLATAARSRPRRLSFVVGALLRSPRALRGPRRAGPRFASSPYDGEIAFVDTQLARLLRALEEQGAQARRSSS